MKAFEKTYRNGAARVFLRRAIFMASTLMVISFFKEYTGIDPLIAFSDIAVPHYSSFQKIGLMVCGMLLFILFTASIGHHGGNEEVSMTFLDRIPFEVLLAAFGAVAVARGITLVNSVAFIYYKVINDARYVAQFGENLGSFMWAFFGLWSAMMVSLLLLWDTFVARLKNRQFLRTTLFGVILVPALKWAGKILAVPFVSLWRAFRKALRDMRSFAADASENMPLVALFGIVMAGSLAIDLFIIMAVRYMGTVRRTYIVSGERIFQQVLGFIILASIAIGYQKIRDGTKEIASGDTEYKIDTSNMPSFMKGQAEDLNSINDAVAQAVEHQMKSERMKTELITNVSHDIKTPLTSIINYVDLMEKEEIYNPKISEYLSVISRQSAKLKKLIDDLVQASKASTGNVEAELEPTDITLLLRQMSAEYSEKAEEAGLTWTMSVPEKELYIISDGKLLWRVLDNLMNNRVKYSLPGTRIYTDCAERDGRAVVTIKNVSKEMLNISADELMERFVRGDSSRNTEGSGLGLSISQSLMAILGGTMDITVDGDLFKVELGFDLIRGL